MLSIGWEDCVCYFNDDDDDGWFYIALFYALEQTHCARMWFIMSDELFIMRFWIFTEVVYLRHWHGWCHMKLPPSRHKFCVHHTTMHHVTSCKVLCTPYNHAPCHFMPRFCVHHTTMHHVTSRKATYACDLFCCCCYFVLFASSSYICFYYPDIWATIRHLWVLTSISGGWELLQGVNHC